MRYIPLKLISCACVLTVDEHSAVCRYKLVANQCRMIHTGLSAAMSECKVLCGRVFVRGSFICLCVSHNVRSCLMCIFTPWVSIDGLMYRE